MTPARAVVPLLDVLFLLLFALLALSEAGSARTRDVRVELPAVETGAGAAPPAAAPALMLVLDADSMISLADGTPVRSEDDLERALSRAIGEGLPDQVPIELVADRAARHGVAVALLEHLRRRGFADVHLVATGAETSELFGEAPR